jgi:hypothetical protein
MRRFVVTSIAAASLAAAAAIPLTAAADPGIHVHGEGDLSPFDKGEFVNHFNFELVGAPDGSSVRGKVMVKGTVDQGAGKEKHDFSGDPVCMKVVGSQATFVVQFTKTKNEPSNFAGAQFWVADNSKNQQDPTDGVIDNVLNDAQLARASCDTPAPRPIKTIAKGDVRIDNS